MILQPGSNVKDVVMVKKGNPTGSNTGLIIAGVAIAAVALSGKKGK